MTRTRARRGAAASPRKPRVSLNGSPEVAATEEQLLTRVALAVAGVLAVALLIMAFGPHRIGDYFTETDFYGAYAAGAKLNEHGQLIPSRYGVIGPGYELTLGIVGFLIPDLFRAAELISVVATIGTLLLWFGVIKRLAGARLGLFAVLFMATNPYFFHYGFIATTDAFAVSLQVVTLFLLLGGGTERRLAAAGLVAAFAFLTRYNVIYLLPAGLIAVFGGSTGAERRLRGALLFAAGFFAPVIPWVAYSLTHGAGSFQLHHNIAYEIYAHARGIAWDDYQKTLQPQFKTLWDVIARDPKAVVNRMLFNLGDHLRLDAQKLLGWPVATCAVVGLLLGIKDGTLRPLRPIVIAALLLFATLVPVFYSGRYSLSLLPFYATLAGTAFASPLLAVVVGTRSRFWLKPLVAVAPLGAAIVGICQFESRALTQLPTEVIECAKTLRSLKASGDRVIARKSHIAYHGGVEAVPFPFTNTIPELAAYAKREHARWLYFSWPEAETRPRYWYLLDTSAVIPGLTVRRALRSHPAVLYEIGPDFGAVPPWLMNDTLVAWHTARAQLLVDAHNPQILHQFAGVAWMRGRPQEARQALEEAAQIKPDDVDILLLLGTVLLDLNEAGEAAAVFARAENLAPNNARTRLGRGWASLLAGQAQEAGELWRPVITATEDPVTLERMAALYAMLGDREAQSQALDHLRRVRGQP